MDNKERRALKLNIRKAALLSAAALLLLGGALTLAWYSHSAQADSELTAIGAHSSASSLYISAGTSPDGLNSITANVSITDVPLFPISTTDCVHWYYVNDDVVDSQGNLDTYALVDFTAQGADAATGLYLNPNKEGDDKRTYAYYKADFVFCSTGGELSEYDVYLDASYQSSSLYSPISVSHDSSTSDSLYFLDKAVRIAVVDQTSGSPVLRFIYAPVAESGKGNSASTTADTFWGVSGQNTVQQLNTSTKVVTLETLAGTGCVEGGGTPICVAGNGSEGHPCGKISVYIWLEGTDAQTRLGKTDNVSDVSEGLRVQLKFVGLTS